MRRVLLGLLVLWMCSCVLGTARAGQALRPAERGAEEESPYTEVEATAVYGQSSGYLGCGEQGILRYAGGGARVRHAMRGIRTRMQSRAASTVTRRHILQDFLLLI